MTVSTSRTSHCCYIISYSAIKTTFATHRISYEFFDLLFFVLKGFWGDGDKQTTLIFIRHSLCIYLFRTARIYGGSTYAQTTCSVATTQWNFLGVGKFLLCPVPRGWRRFSPDSYLPGKSCRDLNR